MSERVPDLIIISGLSGSGKSVALQSLEDVGYYCIDNLPAILLPELGRHLNSDVTGEDGGSLAGVAVSIDSRNKHFLSLLQDMLQDLEQAGDVFRILFLESEEQELIRRYSETRRKHPLTDRHTPLREGIRQERLLLEPLHNRAEKVIDTTDTTPHELRGMIRDFATGALTRGPLIVIESFGFKFGSPREADFVFDVRCLPNPHWEDQLRSLSGLDRPVAGFLESHESVGAMVKEIAGFLGNWLPGFDAENRSYITVAIGCTGGQHRSVYIVEKLGECLAERGINIKIRHRELAK